MKNKITRRTLFGTIAAVLPLGLLGFGERQAAVDHESNVNWFTRAMGHAKKSDYWRDRCLDAEKDLKDQEEAIERAFSKLLQAKSFEAALILCRVKFHPYAYTRKYCLNGPHNA